MSMSPTPVVCTDCGSAFRAELLDVPGGDVMTVAGRPRCRWCLFAAVMAETRAAQAARLEAMWRASSA
jgi:hypothetical protein